MRKAPRRTGGRVLRIAGVMVGLAALIAVLAMAVVWVHAARQLEATPVTGLATAAEGAPLNLLVVHTESLDSVRPLSIGVLQLRDGADPRVLALPLELEVTTPGASPTLLADALADGGHDRLVAAIQDYTGVPLHHLVRVNLDGLERLAAVAAGPGCPDGACLDDQHATIRREGLVPLDLIAGHAGVVTSLAGELSRPGALASPLTVKAIVDAGRTAVATDVDLGPRSALAVLRVLADADTRRLEVLTVPGFHDPATGRTTPYWEQAETVFQAFRDGTPVPAGLGRTDPIEELLVPENVRVLVLNGVGVEGLAGAVAEQLERAGFDVAGADNVDEFDRSLDRTIVAHRPGRGHEAELVVGVLDGAILEERPDLPRGVDVVVTVGQDQVQP